MVNVLRCSEATRKTEGRNVNKLENQLSRGREKFIASAVVFLVVCVRLWVFSVGRRYRGGKSIVPPSFCVCESVCECVCVCACVWVCVSVSRVWVLQQAAASSVTSGTERASCCQFFLRGSERTWFPSITKLKLKT